MGSPCNVGQGHAYPERFCFPTQYHYRIIDRSTCLKPSIQSQKSSPTISFVSNRPPSMSKPIFDSDDHELGSNSGEIPDQRTTPTKKQRLIENLSLVAAYIHINIAVALVLSLAFAQWPLIHLLLWLPVPLGSAHLLRRNFCRRQYFMCLVVCSTCLWTLVMAMIMVPDLWP